MPLSERWRACVERVDTAQQAQIEGGELVALSIRRLGKVGDVAVGHEMHLEGPARGERHERRPMLAVEDDALGAALEIQNVLEQLGSRAIDAVEQAGRAGRDEWIGVDLAMRMGEGHTDRLTAILEREDLLDARQL